MLGVRGWDCDSVGYYFGVFPKLALAVNSDELALPRGAMTKRQELARCDRELAEARAALLAGDPCIEGLCLAISDWAEERALIEREDD